ncbi:MAG: NAD-dependent epimerase/dehydratase family protein [Acidimicrobiia bacterium]
MRALVTGAAGFVGSTLSEHLIACGDEVLGVDCFTDYYERSVKERNLARLRGMPGFTFIEDDLADAPLEHLVSSVDTVFHLAGQPGVRGSWGGNFETYLRNNIRVTQRLLEAVRPVGLKSFVYASSSSIYGDAQSLPTPETVCPRPVSPYGVTKLAAEHLCELYRTSYGIPTASLRLFTVYGPRQRPDMAFSRLVRAAVTGSVFELYGDGTQTRDFTYVDDVVRAMRNTAVKEWRGVANIGGGERTSLAAAMAVIEGLCGHLQVVRRDVAVGDVGHTGADTTLARAELGFAPETTIEVGLPAMVAAERQVVRPWAEAG